MLPALARLPGLQGLSAMQSINVVVLNRSFLGVFLGTGLLCAALRSTRSRTGRAPLRAALGRRVVVFGRQPVGHQNAQRPWNDAIAALQPQGNVALGRWQAFVAGWSLWNHVRTAASLVAAALLTLALSDPSR